MSARPIRMAKLNIRRTVVSTPRRGTATAKVADPSRSCPGTTRQRITPSVDPTVNSVPLITRGSFRARFGMSGCSRSPVGLTAYGALPSVGMKRTA